MRLPLRTRAVLVLALIFGAMPMAGAAQTADRENEFVPRWEIGSYVGIARHSLAGPIFGIVPDRDHVFVGVQMTAHVIRTRRWAFAYAPEIVPLLLVSNNPRYREVTARNGRRSIVEDGRSPVAGFGISPIGVQAQLRVGSRLRPYVAAAAGVVWFTRAVPVAGSRAFNFTLEMGGGVRWQYRPKDALRIGYKFHHLSNAYTAVQNPGLDAAVFLVGYERALGPSR
jgi:Lipid A 3-O-deacylase (PagL)